MDSRNQNNWLDASKQHAVESFWREVFNQKNHSFSDYDKLSGNDAALKSLFPRCDMYEKENYLYIDVELPGVSQDDVSMILKGQDLIIKGKYSTLQPSLQYYLKEREDRSFNKTLTLPVKVNKLEIHSSFEHGLLTIKFPIISEEDAVPIYIDLSTKTISPPEQPYK